MIRAFATWSWLVAVTSTAVMLAPHLPMVVGQHVVNAVRDRGQG